jgi:uncharacterized membrane protein
VSRYLERSFLPKEAQTPLSVLQPECLIGWWVTVMIAFLLNVKVSSTMKGTGVGLVVGAFVFWASYQGLLRWVPNPVVITAITLIVFSAIGRMIIHKAEQASRTPSTM